MVCKVWYIFWWMFSSLILIFMFFLFINCMVWLVLVCCMVSWSFLRWCCSGLVVVRWFVMLVLKVLLFKVFSGSWKWGCWMLLGLLVWVLCWNGCLILILNRLKIGVGGWWCWWKMYWWNVWVFVCFVVRILVCWFLILLVCIMVIWWCCWWNMVLCFGLGNIVFSYCWWNLVL